MQPAVSRLVIGFALLGGAIMARLVAADGGPVMDLGPHLPMLTRIDFVTGPLAFVGVAVLATARGLGPVRRVLGVLALIAAAGWPALKFGSMSPVLLSFSDDHGIHLHDLVAFPVLATSLSLLAPWRSALGGREASVVRRWAPASLRPIAQH